MIFTLLSTFGSFLAGPDPSAPADPIALGGFVSCAINILVALAWASCASAKQNQIKVAFAGYDPFPTNTRHQPNIGLMFGQHRRWWYSIKQTVGQSSVFPELIQRA